MQVLCQKTTKGAGIWQTAIKLDAASGIFELNYSTGVISLLRDFDTTF